MSPVGRVEERNPTWFVLCQYVSGFVPQPDLQFECGQTTKWRPIVKNQKPNNRSRTGMSNKSKPIVTDKVEKSQNPPEIIVLPNDMLPNNKPNIESPKPTETPSEDKPNGEKPSDKK